MKEGMKILVLPAQLVSTKSLLIILHYSCYNIHGGWVIIRIKTKTNPWIATFRDSNDERGRKARDTCGRGLVTVVKQRWRTNKAFWSKNCCNCTLFKAYLRVVF